MSVPKRPFVCVCWLQCYFGFGAICMWNVTQSVVLWESSVREYTSSERKRQRERNRMKRTPNERDNPSTARRRKRNSGNANAVDTPKEHTLKPTRTQQQREKQIASLSFSFTLGRVCVERIESNMSAALKWVVLFWLFLVYSLNLGFNLSN